MTVKPPLRRHDEPSRPRIDIVIRDLLVERALPTRQALAQALPEHRYCTDNIRGHESCLAVADTILRNLEGGK